MSVHRKNTDARGDEKIKMNEELDQLKVAFKIGEISNELHRCFGHLSTIREKVNKEDENAYIALDYLLNNIWDELQVQNFFEDVYKED